jgi:hypothetical protein
MKSTGVIDVALIVVAVAETHTRYRSPSVAR